MERLNTGTALKKRITLAVVLMGTLFIAGAQELPSGTDEERDLTFPERPAVPEEYPSFSAGQADDNTPNRTTQRVLGTAETAGERHRREITEEASAQLFNMNIWDTNVSLYLNGYWKGSLSVNWGLANSPMGTAPETKDSPLLFTQEADLTLSLWIWQKWFLEVSFIDDYDLNTYRAGYQGFPGETIQYVGIGNTGMDFPVFPYLDLGGDSTSSFGVYGRFGSEELTFHTMVRYDAAAREERTFVGNRERNFSTTTPNKPLRGRSFVLPDENISSIPVVYLEDKDGPLSGGGRRWRIATPSEYAVSSYEGLVELVREPQGMVAVSYIKNGASSYWQTSLGYYNSGVPLYAPGTGFLGKVQEHFGSGIDLSNYPQPGGSAGIPGTININNINALVIYEPGTFSPFERQSRYMAPSNTTEDAALIRLSSGERLNNYDVIPANTLSMDIAMYILTGDDTGRNIFEIIYQNYGRERRNPYSCWPLADDFPELYLPGSQVFNEDIRLRFTSYGAAGAYYIGTDVIPGSVMVYRAGILDSQVNYDAGSGNVTLASPVGFSEVIRISYLKRSEERRLGSLAAGVGLIYKPENSPFSIESALGMRWNISQEAYTEEGAASPGTVGLSARTSWDYDRLKASLSLGLAFEQPDTTGLYRIAGMEGNSEIVLGMSTTSGFISGIPAMVNPAFSPGAAVPPSGWTPPFTLTASNRASLVYRNYRESNFLGNVELKSIEWSAPVISGLEGPYPASESIVGDVYVAEFQLNSSQSWTGFQAPLGMDGALLEQAREIVIPLRFYNFSTNSPDILVVAQFGVFSDENSNITENPGLMIEAPIFYRDSTGQPLPAGLIERPNPPAGQTIAIALTDEMRRKLQNANHMRILIINTGSVPFSGRVLVAKPYILGAGWRAITLDAGTNMIRAARDEVGTGVTVTERTDSSLKSAKINRLHDNTTNHVLEVKWTNMTAAGTDGRTSIIPLSDYRVLSFYLKMDRDAVPSSDFHFLIARGPEAYNNPNVKPALEFTINSNYLPPADPSGWYNIEIHYRDKKVYINGHPVDNVFVDYNPSALRESSGNGDFVGEGQSGYIAAFVTSTVLPDGTFSIDEICLEDPSPTYRLNGGATLDWRHPEALITIGDTTVVSGAVFNTALESAVVGNPFEGSSETFAGFQSRSRGELTVLDTRLSGNLNYTVSNDNSYWSAGHGISRSFGPLSISDIYNTAPPPNDETMSHSLSIRLNTLVYGNLSSSINYQYHRLSRQWTGATGMQSERNGRPGFSLEGNLNYLEKTEKVRDWMPNYAGTWAQSWTAMFPDSGSGSVDSSIQNRDIRGRAGFDLDYLPVGLELSFDGNSTASIPFEYTRSGSSARIEAPFSFGNLRGRLRSQRDVSQAIGISGAALGDDLVHYGQSLSETSPLWKNVPVFALFNTGLGSDMENTRSNFIHKNLKPENIRFHELIALNLVFPERYDAFSLIVPVSHYIQFDRTMEQRMDTLLDVHTISSGFGFSSINLFGSMGTNPVFKFYRNDELRHAITGIVSIPAGENPIWRIQAEQNLRLFGFNGAELDIQNTYTITRSNRTGWIDSFILLWTVPREKTLLSSLYSSGMQKIIGKENFPSLSELASSEYERFIRESLELVLDYSDEYSVFSLFLGHESVVRIVGRLTLTGFAKAGLQRDERYDTISLLLSFGTTLSISF